MTMKTPENEGFRIGYLWKNLDMSEPESRQYYDSQATLNPCWGSFDSEEEALERLKEWNDGPYVLIKTFSSR